MKWTMSAKSVELVPFYCQRGKRDLEGDTSLPDVPDSVGDTVIFANVRSVLSIN